MFIYNFTNLINSLLIFKYYCYIMNSSDYDDDDDDNAEILEQNMEFPIDANKFKDKNLPPNVLLNLFLCISIA